MQTNEDATIGALVNSAITDTQNLVRHQIDLARAEVTQSAKQAASASGMFIVAGVLAFLAFVFLLVAGAYGIVAAGLPVWAGFLIVAGVLLVVTAILALVGRSQAKKISPPDRAKSQITTTVTETKSALKGSYSPVSSTLP